MFSSDTYTRRRKALKEKFTGGVLFFPGNGESPMNYPANPYPFRQDSSFLYYWGLDYPGLAAVIDVDNDREIIFGDELTVDDIIWMGPQETIAAKAERVGVTDTASLYDLGEFMKKARKNGRHIRFLPQYRAENILWIRELTGMDPDEVNRKVSIDLIRAVADQRNVKSGEEVAEIEKALDISVQMNSLAMKLARPGLVEQEVCGAVEGLVLSRGSAVSFPVIYSIHGETLHNHAHRNTMKEGDLLVFDSGAESPLHYASDITRTYPVSGTFTQAQRDIYTVCLNSQLEAIEMMAPSVPFRDVHLHAASVITRGLQDIGLMKGDAEESVQAGAHALFFPHGLGHMMGLDVHDMENLGEEYVGYDGEITRSSQFGLSALRMGRRLKEGFVVMVEPGIYFIPELIDQWKKEDRLSRFIDYAAVEKYRGFGGVRIEDDVLITEDHHRVLGTPIPKDPGDVEAACAG